MMCDSQIKGLTLIFVAPLTDFSNELAMLSYGSRKCGAGVRGTWKVLSYTRPKSEQRLISYWLLEVVKMRTMAQAQG